MDTRMRVEVGLIFLVTHTVVETKSIFMREITAIEPDWPAELAPRYWKKSR